MASQLFTPPSRAFDASGNILSGALWYFYQSGTTTPQSVYSDSALGTPLSNPVVADSGGKFVPIFLNSSLNYRAVLKSSDGATTIHDIDPISGTSNFVTLTGAQSISGKTFTGGATFTHPDSSTTGAVIVNDAVGNPGGGYVQFTNNAKSVEYSYIRGVSGSIQVSGNIHPVTDNGNSCGLSSKRWSVVYAGTGAINTSDANHKTDIVDLSDAERRAAKRIAVKRFRYRDAVGVKGDAARYHIGVIAQEVQAAFEAEGLDPFAYGVVCLDETEDGPIMGIRYDELYALMLAAVA